MRCKACSISFNAALGRRKSKYNVAKSRRAVTLAALTSTCARSECILRTKQQLEQHRTGPVTASAQTFVKKLQFMSEIAYLADLGHARTALERMQIALQGFELKTVVDIGHPAMQASCSAFDQIEPFLEEDFHQFGVVLG